MNMKKVRNVFLAVVAMGAGMLFSSQMFAYPICQYLAGKHQTVGVSGSNWPTTLVFGNVVPRGNGYYSVYGYTVRNGVAYPMYGSYCKERGYGYYTPWTLCVNSRDVRLVAHGVTDRTYEYGEFHAMMARLHGYYKNHGYEYYRYYNRSY